MINILGYNLLEFDEYISETVIVLDKHRDYEMLNGIKWYFIELPKFRKQRPDMNKRINQWISFIDDFDEGAVKMAESKNKILKKARQEMNYLTGDAAVRRLEELKEKWEMDYVSSMNYAERKGKEEGIKEGKKEEKIQVAKKLLDLGVEISNIIEATGLSKEEVEKLQKDK